ncbi:MAG: homocysteine S-methyltransferase [Woeseiaceae bacterium]|nr:homocysteine S-methyltransferase [Woeseiaceae bacterium]
MANAFLDALTRDRPLILDGGLSTQLEAQGCDIGGVLWSAALLQSNPEQIVSATRAFVDAGAECVATATYQASREGFAQVGVSQTEADALMLSAVALARQAGPDVVAASLGPYGAMLHDGSEYRGDYGVPEATLRAFHAPRLAMFNDSDADVLALETIPSFVEARALAGLLAECTLPSWVSFSCRDGRHISDGTPIEEAVGVFAGISRVAAVGINCTPPQYAQELIERVGRALPGKIIIAYPNSGENYNVDNNSWSGTVTARDCAAAARTWVASGAGIVGGCCRMGPEHIRAIKQALM